MDILGVIKNRRSVRKFLDVPVSWDLIGLIMEAGKAAPSAGNLQPWKFIACTDESVIKQVATACLQQNWIATAPVVIVVVCDATTTKQHYGVRGEKLYSIQGCAACIENMLLVAHSLGLGACWVGAFEEIMLRNALGIPEEVRPQAVIPIGYPDEKPPEPVEFPLENLVYHNKFGAGFRDLNVITKQYGDVWRDWAKKGRKAVQKKFGKGTKKLKKLFKRK
ncbi:nitroreductase family protein [Candidatus Woesearchaeota archaeon]|nr:MAG: nitroreductase family protein [Candidatus Woesearchaeota archaeon]